MTQLADQLTAIAEAPAGPGTAAFFDLDGTLINGFSAKAVFLERLKTLDVTVRELWEISSAVVEMRMRNSPVDNLMGKAVKGLEGRRDEDLMTQAYTLFRNEIAPMIYPQARILVEAHRHAGHRLIIATSATPYQAIPVREDMMFDELLCTTPVVTDGVLTGELVGDSLWGPRKAQAVTDYAEREKLDLAECFVYSNGGEDVPMLLEAGRPVALNPDAELDRYAKKAGWPILRLESPRRGTDLTSVVRSTAAMGAVIASAGIGIGLGILTRSRRTGANITSTVAPDIALTLAGIELDVTGTENAWSARPAVFMFNHQSAADSLIVTSILRRDITAVAKRELERDPRFALLGMIFDVAYIDRGDPAKAREALLPAIEKLHSGISVAIAPEGTRMPTSRLGRFKKGGFHLAMQAKVPIVPIVIHNAGDVMWKNDFTAHSGTVKVTVGEPIPTTGWEPDKLDSYIDDVRSYFDRTLGYD
ncbi:HAD-IB family hydrolase [Rhodococcus sp. PAMC28707]|uniref:HAD-IB family hydrolase n=1 Tax=unclassified Rhodococcus (in: high G+C Gram-positive bacteria) TaxID=192944 RepID=UPI00109E00C4|nr:MULTISPECIES: HAD-IB family hydrolase [unclassified Rhodococcus (in: high G+C Gram-positive bacteria)]QCB49744.1 HAD-IB family hydrolase [Rhodococcus sp. PAMC28705]QCB58563.1 HAD-IB family hydrolase [Rhodococcus sp. PAMC28707]